MEQKQLQQRNGIELVELIFMKAIPQQLQIQKP